MRELVDHALTQWVILGLAIMGFFLLAKSGVSYLPNGGILGAIKRVVLAA